MFKKSKYIIYFISVILAAIACNPENFELPVNEAEFILPVVDMELGMDDLIILDTTGTLIEDQDGFVSFFYKYGIERTFDEIITIGDVQEDFTIPGIPSEWPNFEVPIPILAPLLGILPGDYTIFPSWNINYETEVQIKEFIAADFNSGIISLELRNYLPMTLNSGLIIEIINQGESEPLFSFNLPSELAENSIYIFPDVDISGRKITGDFTFRLVNLGSAGASNISIDELDGLEFDLSFINIALSKASFLNPDFDLPSVYFDLPLIFPNGARIEELKLDNGSLRLDIPDLKTFFVIKTTLPTTLQNGMPLTYNVGESNIEIPLENLHMDLSTQDPAFNILPVQLQLVFKETVDTLEIIFNNPLNGSVEISDIDYDYLNGYLGLTPSLVDETIDLDLFERIQSGSLKFFNSKINIIFKNGVGVRISLLNDGDGLYIKGSNQRLYGDQTATIGQSLDGFTLVEAPKRGEIAISTLTLDENNEPEFNDLIALFPTYIEARIPVLLGTSYINMDQFIEDKAPLGLDLEFDIPLHYSADNFILTDTTPFSIELEDRPHIIKSGSFASKFTSFFPLDLEIQTLFLDSNMVVLDSLFDVRRRISPAALDENNLVTEPLIAETIILINQDEIDQILNTAYLVTNVKIITPEGKDVKLHSSYNIKYKLIGDLQVDIDLNR